MDTSWQNILKRFEAVIGAHGDKIALAQRQASGDYHEISYQALRDQALKVAHYIQAKTSARDIGQTPRIALKMPKSSDYIIALWGCLYAGASFTPIDTALPPLRQAFILEDIDPDMILTPEALQEISEVEAVPSHSFTTDLKPEQLAYIIYTSGSTGKPKGVMVSHRGLSNVIFQQIKAFDIQPGDRSLWLLSMSFDASLSDILCVLLSGATLYIDNREPDIVIHDLQNLICYLSLTYLDIPPAVLSLLSPTKAITRSLKTIVIGGEVADFKTVRVWAAHIRLINVYGPTEATICTSMGRCDQSWNRALIGKPLDNVIYTIADNGELLIGGKQLALGYWNNDALTASKFIEIDNIPFYRTGDRVSQDKDGALLFHGRLDRQTKIRGQLVELDEVEQAIQSHEHIQDAAIITADKKLICFYKNKTGMGLNTVDLSAFLETLLPSYMIPHFFIEKAMMPRTATGKIDYKALEKAYKNLNQLTHRPLETPQNPVEKKLYHLWADLLGTNNFGLNDSFFKIGGDSLKAVEFTLLAEEQGLSLSPNLLAEKDTIRDLARSLDEAQDNNLLAGGMDSTQLKALAELPATIKDMIKKADKTEPSAKKPSCFFMTGASGFLGARLIHDILKKDSQARFICLIRANDNAHAKARLDDALEKQNLVLNNQEKSRIDYVLGDIAKPNLGLCDNDYNLVCEQADQIIHSAALVNIVRDFEYLRGVNFDPVFALMRLALKANIKRLHNISTLSVFVSTSQNEGRVLENDDLQEIKTIYGGYAQTKFASEIALHNKRFTKICPVTSYRLGLITGDTKSGISAPHDFLSTFIKGLTTMGSVPRGDHDQMQLDVTPVDYAAHIMSDLMSRAPNRLDDCYHIANRKGFSLQQIIERLKTRHFQIETLDATKWHAKNRFGTPNFTRQITSMALCRCFGGKDFERLRGMDLFQATNIIFDQQRVLKAGCPPCPPANDDLLDLYLDHILN